MAAGYYRQLMMLPRAAGESVAVKKASLLYHFDEPTGGTNLSDSGIYSWGMVVSNTACTTNTPIKFSNVLTYGSLNDKNHIMIPWHPMFIPRTNDWSVDFWMYFSTVSRSYANATLVILGGQSPANQYPFVRLVKANYEARWFLEVSTNGTTVERTLTPGNIGPAASNAWLHIAIYRYTNTLHLYTNGVRCVTGGCNYDFGTNTIGLSLGEYKPYAGAPADFYDEFRYCVGSAMPYRGTNFTPPTAAYTGYE
jgi:hypothetical protein